MKHLKLLRESRGISQQKLADQFCLSQQSIYKYENGLAEPDFSTLRQFADYFHTTIDYLINDDDNSKIDLVISVTPKDAYEKWQFGLLIQEAWPEGSATERETLISGLCKDCQEGVFNDVQGETGIQED